MITKATETIVFVLVVAFFLGVILLGMAIFHSNPDVSDAETEPPTVEEAAMVSPQPATVPDSVRGMCTITTIEIYLSEHLVNVWGNGNNANYSRTFRIADFPDEIAVLRLAIEARIGE